MILATSFSDDGDKFEISAVTSKHNANAAQFTFIKNGEVVFDTGFVAVNGPAASLLTDLIKKDPNLSDFSGCLPVHKEYMYPFRIAGSRAGLSVCFYVHSLSGKVEILFEDHNHTVFQVAGVEVPTSVKAAALTIAKEQNLTDFINILQ